MSKERPILFSDSMVRAILAGRKTQTRRVVKEPRWALPGTLEPDEAGCIVTARVSGCMANVLCPYGAPGDRLWVREAFLSRLNVDPEKEPERARHYALYRAHSPGAARDPNHWHPYPSRWTPAARMPRWASRITLEVDAVRVERIQAITDADVKSEGVTGWSKDGALYKYAPADHEGDGPCWPWTDCPLTPREGFAKLWDELAPEGSRWADDPWVWVIGFKGKGGAYDAR